MTPNNAIARLTRIVTIAAALGFATQAAAIDSIRVFVVKENKSGISVPAARDAGKLTRALAKRFGVKAPKAKTSVVQIDLPAAAWDANKLEITEMVAARKLAVVVVDESPELGDGWAVGLSFKERDALVANGESVVEISFPGRNIKQLADRVLIDMMDARIEEARRRHQRGGLNGAPSEEGSMERPGKFDIDYGPGGAPIRIDCEEPSNADDPACKLSPSDGDTDPAREDDDLEGDSEELPFDPRDCDPFVDARCGGSDPCSLGLGADHPLSEALGCGFLDAVEDGALGPRTEDDDATTVHEDYDLDWDADADCEHIGEDREVCTGGGTFELEGNDKICRTHCDDIVCTYTQTDDKEERWCRASGCSERDCS